MDGRPVRPVRYRWSRDSEPFGTVAQVPNTVPGADLHSSDLR